MKKFCIAAQGGGMVACYHSGVISALKEKFGFHKLSRVIATSGAAATYSYLVSGQQELIQPIWADLVGGGKFVTPWKFPPGKRVMNIDFLVDEIIRKKYPVDLQALNTSPVRFEVGVTDAGTGDSVFFPMESRVDFFELLRASCCVPYVSRDKVMIDGRAYCDGTIGSVSGLERTGNEENILLVLTRPDRPLKKLHLLRKIMGWLLIRGETRELRDAIWDVMARYNDIPRHVKQIRRTKNIAVIQPKKPLPIFRIDTSLDRMTRTIRQGYTDTMEHTGLDEFFARMA